MAYFLAVDAGGTKTDYLLADETRTLARVRGGTIKRMRADAAVAGANLDVALAELTAKTGVAHTEVTRTCIGTAGNTVALVTDWLREALHQRVGGELILIGDVEIALDAAFYGGPGVLVLAGTGSNVAARGADGALLGAGGWGPMLADQGSAQRIGLQGLRAGFLARDEGRETNLLREAMLFWNLLGEDELIAYGNSVPVPDFALLAPLVHGLAVEGDRVAAEVLRREGEDLGYLVRLLFRRLGASAEAAARPKAPEIAFAGTIMEKVQPVRTALLDAVRQEFPAAIAQEGVIDSIEGALWHARGGARDHARKLASEQGSGRNLKKTE